MPNKETYERHKENLLKQYQNYADVVSSITYEDLGNLNKRSELIQANIEALATNNAYRLFILDMEQNP